ncbi:Protein kinase domain-containing protein [Psidium guajava]|nr:Protein kinase domain-containing protein [Psidium guajava]
MTEQKKKENVSRSLSDSRATTPVGPPAENDPLQLRSVRTGRSRAANHALVARP